MWFANVRWFWWWFVGLGCDYGVVFVGLFELLLCVWVWICYCLLLVCLGVVLGSIAVL